jgi:ribosome-associated heat shock protein Hsp15
MNTEERLRLDKWLVHARFCKTRGVASELIERRKIRLNRKAVSKPSHMLKVGDVLTLPSGRDIVVVRVRALGQRRGPASEARGLYDELSPAD